MVDALGNPVGFFLTGSQAHDLAGADHLRECQKPGALRRELNCWVAKPPVQHSGPDLKHTMGALGRPAHLPALVHAGTHQLIDGALGPRGRDRRECQKPGAACLSLAG